MNVFFFFISCMILFSCTPTPKNLETVLVNDKQVLVLDESEVTEKRKVPISELVDGYELIPFEDSQNAYFKMQWMYFTENYICVRQENGPVKLFDKEGRFVHNVGDEGHGPGEYISAYDVLLDEKSQSIYVAPFIGADILRYNFQGDYTGKLTPMAQVTKGRLFLPSDSVLSLVHLCFLESSDKFTAADMVLSDPKKTSYVYNEALAVRLVNEKNEGVGFNQEVFSYRNTDRFAFYITSSDTLYHYDHQKDEMQAVFTMKLEKESDFFLVNELPHHYLTHIVNNSIILTEKETGKSCQAEFINDYIGNTPIFPRIQDGYLFMNMDPETMTEELKKTLESGDYPEGQEEHLRKLLELFASAKNDVLFRAKLKK